MSFEKVLPWRVRNRVNRWLEESVRPARPRLYKLVKFGRTNLNTPEYWDRVWRAEAAGRNYPEIFSAILERVPQGARVLDVGCGAGQLARLLRDARAARVTGLDFSPWACEQLVKAGFETVVSALPRIPLPDRSFDVAVATEVLEHLDSPAATVREMARVVRSGGLLMCSVPDDALHPHEELEHQHAFTAEIFRAMFAPVADAVEASTAGAAGCRYLFVAARVRH